LPRLASLTAFGLDLPVQQLHRAAAAASQVGSYRIRGGGLDSQYHPRVFESVWLACVIRAVFPSVSAVVCKQLLVFDVGLLVHWTCATAGDTITNQVWIMPLDG
jgi:hypothetical protein